MSEYVHPMDTSASGCASGSSSCDSAAGNAINQWQNAPIVGSGDGISMGGADAGTADNPPATNPTGSGGGAGSGVPGTALAGDISNVCSSDQIQKGYISQGGACVPGFTPGGTNASPWQNDLQTAKLLIELASGYMTIAGVFIALFLADMLNPFLAGFMDTYIIPHLTLLSSLVFATGLAIIGLSVDIADKGGHSQALSTALFGGLLTLGSGLIITDDLTGVLQMGQPSFWIMAASSLGIMISQMLSG